MRAHANRASHWRIEYSWVCLNGRTAFASYSTAALATERYYKSLPFRPLHSKRGSCS
jgi:hypothetical protein